MYQTLSGAIPTSPNISEALMPPWRSTWTPYVPVRHHQVHKFLGIPSLHPKDRQINTWLQVAQRYCKDLQEDSRRRHSLPCVFAHAKLQQKAKILNDILETNYLPKDLHKSIVLSSESNDYILTMWFHKCWNKFKSLAIFAQIRQSLAGFQNTFWFLEIFRNYYLSMLSVLDSILIKWPPQGHERWDKTASGVFVATSHCSSDMQLPAKFSHSQ